MFKFFAKIEAWVHSKPPIVSSFSHAVLVSLLIAFGALLTWVSSLADPDLPIRFDIFFYGFGMGAYFLREYEDYRRYEARGDKKGIKDSVLDFFVPMCVGTFVFAVVFARSLA